MASGSGPQVDVMNDPAYNASSASGPNDNGESDHCRICRSEGSREEPLFHPCKCSGSIKFVHQECLLEWLQHSQKKHCELCKTPFHFTKLYDPHMPNSIPTPLFLERLVRHLFKNLLLWARAVLVGCVWLGGLPWCVRWMWRAWFWLSDGGWWSDQSYNSTRAAPTTTTPLTSLPGTATVSSAGVNATSSATWKGIIAFLRSPLLSGPVTSPVNGGNIVANATSPSNITLSNTTVSIGARLGGLFIDPNPFHNLTRYPAVNGVIVDIFEGQLLTALIVISFILIFLIREWVVQQQPALGAAVGMPQLEEIQAPQGGNFQPPLINPPRINPPQEEPMREQQIVRPSEQLRAELDPPGPAGGEPIQPRVIARPRRRRLYPEGAPIAGPGADDMDQLVDFSNPNTDVQTMQKYGQGHVLGTGSSRRNAKLRGFGESSDESIRRSRLSPKGVSPPTEIQRVMEEIPEVGSSRSIGSSAAPPYDFGFSFMDRDQSPSPIYTPESGSSSGSRTPARFGGPPSHGDFHRLSASELDIVDMGTPPGRGKSLFNFSGTGISEPITAGESTRSSPTEGQVNQGKQPEPFFQTYEGSLDNEDQWEDEDEVDEAVESKGKGKGTVSPTTNSDTFPYRHSSRAGGLDKIFGLTKPSDSTPGANSDGFIVGAQAPATGQDSPPSISLPSTPTTSGSLPDHSSLTTHPGDDRASVMLDQEEIHQGREEAGGMAVIGSAGRADRMELEVGGRGDARVIEVPGPVPALDGPPQRLFGWLGDQEGVQLPARGRDDDTESDDDSDEEDNDDDDAGGPIPEVPPDVQQAIADEDAADDFDGIMELIGMRGPLVGLLQNAAISSVLITTTVALGVAFPYVMGKIVMIILANPIFFLLRVPATVVSFFAEFAVESSTCLLFSFLVMVEQVGRYFFRPVGYIVPVLSGVSSNMFLSDIFKRLALDGKERVSQKMTNMESLYMDLRTFPSTGAPPMSALTRQGWSKASLGIAWSMEKLGLGTNQTYSLYLLREKGINVSTPIAFFNSSFTQVIAALSRTGKNASHGATPAASLRNLPSLDPVYTWSVWDRVAAVFFGYALFTVVGMLYLQNARRRSLATGGGIIEKFAVELLSQAGGVMKVVLIIGIEMLVFPLYCGLLLDFALLPLFEEATILSRIQFFADFPLTSVFVHWFVGTCYMFHFALFVSMCRKIMRPGVLYFIRDPDDPTFHPVKDVLDRPVMMQLRKIGFSALIYGVLVLVCLGGVVWPLYLATEAVLPIHWSSNEPVLEFPVDLLFYNFFMPIAVQFFKPSDGLQKMYGWWFRRCACFLRLTCFMFGDRTLDEEGHHVRPDWTSWLLRKRGDPKNPVTAASSLKEVREGPSEVYFQKDGRYVRAPASDSVRRPKGTTVFIPVDEENVRLDGQQDSTDSPNGPNSPDFQLVYLPPWFKTRIGLLVLAIWGFAAFTGLGVTIGPLILGRTVLKQLVPQDIKLNDIYAFSVGIYIIGGCVYAGTKWKLARKLIRRGIRTARERESLWQATSKWLVRAAKISYVLTAFGIVLPTLLALMIEFYVIIPIHTYFSNDDQHVIHFIQDWTLGVLYIKMMGRMLLINTESAWARSLRGVVARGYLDPDVKLATKHFIAPAGGFMLAALLLPLGLGFLAANTFLKNAPAATISQIYRYSYPAVFAIFFLVGLGYLWKILVDSWKQSIMDEVYLTGEQLHNHGEDAPPTATTTAVRAIALE